MWGRGHMEGERWVGKATSLSRALETGLERSKPRKRLPGVAPIQLPFLATTLSGAELGTRPSKSSYVQAPKANVLQREALLCVFELGNFILESQKDQC